MSMHYQPPSDACHATAACTRKILFSIVFVLLLTGSSAWSIGTVIYALETWHHPLMLLQAAIPTLCLVWLFVGKPRRAVALWLISLAVTLAWWHTTSATLPPWQARSTPTCLSEPGHCDAWLAPEAPPQATPRA